MFFNQWQPGEDGHQPVEEFAQPVAYIVSQLKPGEDG